MIQLEGLSRIIEPMLRPLRQRILSIVSRAILESVKDSGGIQMVKVSLLEGETREGLERVQNFGFTSNPPEGAEAVAVFAGGNREVGFIIACDHRQYRFKPLASGESALYTDDGTVIHLKKGGIIEVKAATKVEIDAPELELTGNLTVSGNVDAQGSVSAQTGLSTPADVAFGPTSTSLAALKTAYNLHGHPPAAPVPPDQLVP